MRKTKHKRGNHPMLIELNEHKKHMKEHKKEKKQLQAELMVLQQTIREHTSCHYII